MNIGDIIAGFILRRAREVKEQEGTFYEFEHIKTGAKLAWLDRKEENKTFMIGFKTTPEDSTGVFHILEHSVLNGSKKYPTKEPFVILIKNSLSTFLNAMTYPDKTVYPISSRNEKDFENLMRVYLDAVFYPRLYTNREIFDQEGWHYEKNPEGEGFITNGVVLNEMRGAYSSPDRLVMSKIEELLYSENAYRFESGGDPEFITDLTYEQFVETHKKYYHPSNSLIYLDGEVPLEKTLKVIGEEYLDNFEKSILDFSTPLQSPKPYREETMSYPISAEESTENKAYVAKAYIIGKYDEKVKLTAANLLVDYLAGDNDAPLTKEILEKGLGENIEAFVYSGIEQPCSAFIVNNANENKKDEIYKVIEDSLRNIVDNGLDRERMESLINNSEFHAREQNTGRMPSGIINGLNTYDTWLFGGDPMDALEILDTFATIREGLDNGLFEDLINECYFNSQNVVGLVATPDPECSKKMIEKQKAKIDARVAKMSEEEKEVAMDIFAKLRKAQDTPDSKEDLAKIPQLELSDLTIEPKKYPTENIDDKILFHEVPSRGIEYLTMYIPVENPTREDLTKLSFLCTLLGDLNTENYTSDALNKAITSNLGSIGASLSIFQDTENREKIKVYVRVYCSVLSEKKAKAIELIKEIFLNTKFDDKKKIKDILLQEIDGYKKSFTNGGHSFGLTICGSRLTASGVAGNCTGGLIKYRYFQDLRDNFDSKIDETINEFKVLMAKVFTRNNILVTVTGPRDEKIAKELLEIFPEGVERTPDCTLVPDEIKTVGIEIPSQVSYACQSANSLMFDEEIGGADMVLAKLLALDYFWQEIRVKGGAYGAHFNQRSPYSVSFSTYRDPNPSRSLEIFKKTPEYIREVLTNEEPNITGVIIGTMGDIDPLLNPKSIGSSADGMYLSGRTYEEQVELRKQIVSATAEKLLERVSVIEKARDLNNICVVGNADKIKECNLDEVFAL